MSMMRGPGMSVTAGTTRTSPMIHMMRACARFSACAVAGMILLMPASFSAQQAVSLDGAIQAALSRSPAMAQQPENTDVITMRYGHIIARAALEAILGRDL